MGEASAGCRSRSGSVGNAIDAKQALDVPECRCKIASIPSATFQDARPRTMMGNRGGALHNSDREIVRAYKSRRWITCVLEFRGRRRTVMSERRYTELFFLDEAVAFAAGHRPCAECRRERFNAFKEAWRRARAG